MAATPPKERWELTGLILVVMLVILPTVALSLLGISSLTRAQTVFEREIRDAYSKSAKGLVGECMSVMVGDVDDVKAAASRFAENPTAQGRLTFGSAVDAEGLVILDSRWKVIYPRLNSRAEVMDVDAAIARQYEAALSKEALEGPAAALPLYEGLSTAAESSGGAFANRLLAALGRSYSAAGRKGDAVAAYEKLAAMIDCGGELSLPLLAGYEIWRLTGDAKAKAVLIDECFAHVLDAPAGQIRFYLQETRDGLGADLKATAAAAAAVLTARLADERLMAVAQYSVPSDTLAPNQAGREWTWRNVGYHGKRLLSGRLSLGQGDDRRLAVLFFSLDAIAESAVTPILNAQPTDNAARFTLWERPMEFDRAAYEKRATFKGRHYGTYELGLEGWTPDEPNLIAAAPFPEPFDFWAVAVSTTGGSLDDLARSRMKLMSWMLALTALTIVIGAVSVFLWARRRANLARLQTDFVANVTHELKTPLTGIKSLAETVQLGRVSSPERQGEFLGSIISETERLGRLINNVLDFSRFERGVQRLRFERLDLAELVDRTVGAFKATLSREDAEALVVSLPGEPLCMVADADSITGALWNLLDNAFKYSRPPRKVEVVLAAAHGKATLSVRDNGIGLTPSQAKHVFRKFYRVDTSLAAQTQGVGLGLSLVKAYMKAHGGSVRVQSKPGAGSVFCLTIPMRDDGSGK